MNRSNIDTDTREIRIHTWSITAPGTVPQTPAHSFPVAHLHRTVSWSASCTGILIVRLQPDCSRTIGVEVVTGEEFMRPLSDLGARLPLTLISHAQLPTTRPIQQLPVNLQ